MRIENNITYANINKLVYYNPSYACEDGSGNYDTTLDSYACGGRNKIVDGSGCYITRNAWDSDDSGGSNPNYFSNASGSSRDCSTNLSKSSRAQHGKCLSLLSARFSCCCSASGTSLVASGITRESPGKTTTACRGSPRRCPHTMLTHG